MQLHEKIKAVRNFHGIKQKQMADALNMTVQSYSMKERGNRPITTNELELISEVLNVSAVIFFEDDFNVKFNFDENKTA